VPLVVAVCAWTVRGRKLDWRRARCPSFNTKTVTAHTLRHTAAMRLLQVGTDSSVIALWLGHEQAETTQSMPTSPSKNGHWPGPSRQKQGQGATGRRTSSSRSSKRSDYADLSAAYAATTSGSPCLVGVIPRSA